MNINGKDINIDDLFDQKYMHKEIKKGIFYSSSACGFNGSEYIKERCPTDYAKSEVKYVVDAWALDKLKASDLKEDKTGYSARLITYDELTDNLGYEKNDSSASPSSNGETPSWVYNREYWYSYWTMSQYEDSTSLMWLVYGNGDVNHHYVNSYSDSVRPVITIKKSAI